MYRNVFKLCIAKYSPYAFCPSPTLLLGNITLKQGGVWTSEIVQYRP